MKSLYRILVFFLLVHLATSIAKAQSSQVVIDSLEQKSDRIKSDTAYIETLMDYVWNHARLDRNVSFHFLDEVEKYRDSTGVMYKADKMIYYRGLLYKNERKFNKAEEYLKAFQKIKIAKNDVKWLGACHNVLLNLYVDMEQYEMAVEEGEKAIEFYEKRQDTVGIVRVESRIGAMLSKFGNTTKGMKYIRSAYEKGKEIKDYDTYSFVINDVGYCHEMQGELDSAAFYYKQFSEFSETHNLKYNEMLALFNLTAILEKKGDYKEALVKGKKAIVKSDLYKDINFQSASRFLTATILAKMGRYEEAFQLIKNEKEDGLDMSDKAARSEIYYEYYKQKNNYKKALAYHEKLIVYRDTLKSLDVTEAINEVEAKYETVRKDEKIETLALKDELNQSKISGRNKWIGLLGIGLAALGFLLFRIFSQKKIITVQKNNLSVALEDRNVLLKEIHHRVKNNLQVISSLLSLQSRFVKDDAAQDALKVSKSRVQSMSLLHQKLYGNKDLKSVNVKLYFEDLIENLISTYRIDESKVSFEVEVDEVNLDIDTIVPVGLITNELISNTLKHAFTEQDFGKVYISLKELDDKYQLIVRDNGKGLPFTELPEKSKSLGIQLVKSFTEKLEGEIFISSNDGAEFKLEIPK